MSEHDKQPPGSPEEEFKPRAILIFLTIMFVGYACTGRISGTSPSSSGRRLAVHIDKYERYWLIAVAAMLGAFAAALVATAVVFGIRLPSPVGRVDPQNLADSDFANPGVVNLGNNTYEVHVVAKMWAYGIVRKPASADLAFPQRLRGHVLRHQPGHHSWLLHRGSHLEPGSRARTDHQGHREVQPARHLNHLQPVLRRRPRGDVRHDLVRRVKVALPRQAQPLKQETPCKQLKHNPLPPGWPFPAWIC